jgi:predicted DCC family thiol-disulfide oxidoreductase YuxK
MCDGFVNFVVDRDPSAAIRFGAIQKHMALLDKHGAPTDLSTVVLVQGKTVQSIVHAAACTRVARCTSC